MPDKCPKCSGLLHTLEISEIYDGVCAWLCYECQDYYEVRQGERFKKYEEAIINSIKQIFDRKKNADN